MAYEGYLLKFGSYIIPAGKYMKAESYMPYVNMQDLDPWTDADGYLHRNAIGLKALKVEFETPSMLTNVEFSTWDGCELHSISYSTDDECSESNIAWMNKMEKATDAEETFTQCIMFKSNFHSPLNGGSGFNPDEEYTDWQWWLARSEGGQWKLMTYG